MSFFVYILSVDMLVAMLRATELGPCQAQPDAAYQLT